MKTSNDFKTIAKRSKWKNRVKTILLTLLILGISYVGTRMLTGRLISQQAWEIVHQIELTENVAYPNISTYTWSADSGDMFHGGIKWRQAKNIDGVEVGYSENSVSFNILGQTSGLIFDHDPGKYAANGTRYNLKENQKIPQFYNRRAKSSKSTTVAKSRRELALVKNMPNQLVEMAITFDKPYQLKDIKQMLPSNLKTNWYWIGTTSTGDSSVWHESDLFGASAESLSQSSKGSPIDSRNFLSQLKAYQKNNKGKSTYNNVAPSDDITRYLKTFRKIDMSKSSDVDRLKFSGVILTGKAENFEQLNGKTWIYASSIGMTIPNQPYYQLEKQ